MRPKNLFFTLEKLCDRVALINNGEIIVHDSMELIKATYPGCSLEEVFMNILHQTHEEKE